MTGDEKYEAWIRATLEAIGPPTAEEIDRYVAIKRRLRAAAAPSLRDREET